jgi:glycosyltransferase involved in cell wall biosynthesis
MVYPTVSVVIPTYNRPDELCNSLKTVLNQTYPGKIELLVIDDSPKSQQKIIDTTFSAYTGAKKNRHIIYMHTAKKEGAPKARNKGIEKATGKYLAFLDDDDLWEPEKTTRQVAVMEKHTDIALVVCYSCDKRFGRERISRSPQTPTYAYILKALNLSSSSSYLVRTDVVRKLGGFDVSLPSAQEYDLAIRLSEQHGVYCVPDVLMTQNATAGQISENWTRKIQGLLAIYRKHHHRYAYLGLTDGLLNHLKLLGMIKLYFLGYVVGNRIYGIITIGKELYEQ